MRQFCPIWNSAILGGILREPTGEPWSFPEAGQHLLANGDDEAGIEAGGPSPHPCLDVAKADLVPPETVHRGWVLSGVKFNKISKLLILLNVLNPPHPPINYPYKTTI